jgi:uncharacterized delta-60 repeat protein
MTATKPAVLVNLLAAVLLLPACPLRAAPGDLDLSFNPTLDGPGAAIVLQPDGKVLVGGYFTIANGASRSGIARLNADGTLDATFDPGSGIAGGSGSVHSIALQADGRVIIGGNFDSFNGEPRSRIARLNADGTLDSGFSPGAVVYAPTGVDLGGGYLRRVVLQSDGKVIIAGNFTSVEGVSRNGIARLDANGSLDHSFNPGAQLVKYLPGGTTVVPDIRSMVIQPDGKVLVGGYFHTFDGVPRHGILRVNSDWSLDSSFDPGTGTDSGVVNVVLQGNGAVVISGNFGSVDGVTRRGIARLHPDGSLDNTFALNISGDISSIHGPVLQADGKLIVGVTRLPDANNQFTYSVVARLHADGTYDSNFVEARPWEFPGTPVALQPDGRVFIRGAFTTVNGVAPAYVARLDGEGNPPLRIKLSGQNVVVSWPSTWHGWVLEETSDFALPWNGVTQAPTDDGTNVSVTVPATGAMKIYRARSP